MQGKSPQDCMGFRYPRQAPDLIISGVVGRDYMNPGGLLGKTEVMFAQWSGSNKQPKTSASALDIPSRPSGAKADYEVPFGGCRLTSQVSKAILLVLSACVT